MHELLRRVVLTPDKIQSKLGGNQTKLAQQLVALSKLNQQDLFLAVVNSYLVHNDGEGITDTIIINKELLNFKDLDDLYFQVAELYKEAI